MAITLQTKWLSHHPQTLGGSLPLSFVFHSTLPHLHTVVLLEVNPPSLAERPYRNYHYVRYQQSSAHRLICGASGNRILLRDLNWYSRAAASRTPVNPSLPSLAHSLFFDTSSTDFRKRSATFQDLFLERYILLFSMSSLCV